MTEKVRRHGVKPEEADGKDEGGHYKLIDAPETPAKIKKRMQRCAGCHDDFYNHRTNCVGNNCWSLTRDENFRGKGRPKCFH